MNWLDIVLLIVIGSSVLAGLAKGFARASFDLVSAIVALICGLWFYRMVGAYVNNFVSSVHLANLIGFSLIFVGIVLAGTLCGKLLDKLLRLAHLSWLNRLLGLAFGLLRGVLVSAVIVLAIMAFSSKPPPRSVARSSVAPYVVGAARAMAAAAPYEVKEGFRKSYEKVKEIWADTLKKDGRRLPEQEI